MSNATVLIVPGYHGSGPDHWQSWLETQVPEARRVSGIDWEQPVLADARAHGCVRESGARESSHGLLVPPAEFCYRAPGSAYMLMPHRPSVKVKTR